MTANLPSCLNHRPVDPKRGLPVPFVHDTLKGRWDFTLLLSERMHDCIDKQLCGMCGKSLGYWMVFISGPVSAKTHAYSDPPMHEECGLAALALCPHINRVGMRRASNHPLEGVEGEACPPQPNAIMQRPDLWIMTITRGYTVRVQPNGAVLFIARPHVRAQGWRNRTDQPGLIEVDDVEVAEAIKNAL